MGAYGSSPHTRGAHAVEELIAHGLGIIPAYAGSTTLSRSAGTFLADHPRIRGEHMWFDKMDSRAVGSSPHTRGAPPARLRRGFRARIIPAYAGSTMARHMSVGHLPDHPRIRGEHLSPKLRFGSYAGSSPHTRGALETIGGHVDVARIIPAYAGSTKGG